MKTVQLGKTKQQVSTICLGTMFFGSILDNDTSFDILDEYRTSGGTFLDTANIYAGWVDDFTGGESETLLGEWMQSRGCRNEMFVATKVGGILHRGHEPLHNNQPRLTAEQIIAECDLSLKRLQCDVIDLYYAHVDDRLTPLEETLWAFDNLKQAGKIRYIGASNIASWRLAQANLISELNDLVSYVCVQQKYTYLHPTLGAKFDPQVYVSDELLDYCESNTISLLAYSPLIGGAYKTQDIYHIPIQFQTSHLDKQLKVVTEIADEHQATLHQIVLAWMTQHDHPIIPVIGVDTVKQVRENVQSLQIELSVEQIQHLNVARHSPI